MNETTRRGFRAGKAAQGCRGGGFTLIELLLVLVILAALAAVVVPKFTRRSQQTKLTAARTEIANIQLSLDAFEMDCGRFPTTEEGIGALVEEPSNAEGWQGYLERGIPKDPWGNRYVYQCPGRHNVRSYDLHSFGPDGQSGGDDDIDIWSEE